MLTEIKLKLEEEKTRLPQLQAENEVKVAAARVKAYNVLKIMSRRQTIRSAKIENFKPH